MGELTTRLLTVKFDFELTAAAAPASGRLPVPFKDRPKEIDCARKFGAAGAAAVATARICVHVERRKRKLKENQNKTSQSDAGAGG
jgi:hypothetical protein